MPVIWAKGKAGYFSQGGWTATSLICLVGQITRQLRLALQRELSSAKFLLAMQRLDLANSLLPRTSWNRNNP
jgi:hypothetical protein